MGEYNYSNTVCKPTYNLGAHHIVCIIFLFYIQNHPKNVFINGCGKRKKNILLCGTALKSPNYPMVENSSFCLDFGSPNY